MTKNNILENQNPNEKDFQKSLIYLFKYNLNYHYLENYQLQENNLRTNEKEFLLKPILKEQLKIINKELNEKQIENAILEIEKVNDSDLILANKKFYNFLKKGIDIYNEKTKRYNKVKLIDEENITNNHFLIIKEFKFKGNKNKRCDLVVFLNGFPISVIELKNPYDENVSII